MSQQWWIYKQITMDRTLTNTIITRILLINLTLIKIKWNNFNQIMRFKEISIIMTSIKFNSLYKENKLAFHQIKSINCNREIITRMEKWTKIITIMNMECSQDLTLMVTNSRMFYLVLDKYGWYHKLYRYKNDHIWIRLIIFL